MEQPQVEKIVQDVRKIYEEVCGRPAPGLNEISALASFPLGVDPVVLLTMEYEQLKNLLAAQPLTYAPAFTPAWYPAAEVFETSEHFCVCLDLPGVDKQAIQCGIENNALAIRGERKLAAHGNGTTQATQVMERVYGPFEKIILLPDYVKTDKIDARLSKGVLEIKMAKQAGVKSLSPTGRKSGQIRIDIKES